MKKLVLAAALLSPSAALADFIGVHGAYYQWRSEFSGEIAGIDKYNERQGYGWGVPSFEERGLKENDQYFGYIAFEHPVPLLPNVSLGFSKIEDHGVSPEKIVSRRYVQEIDENLSIKWDIEQDVETQINIDALDLNLYYEVLDNWVNLDLGVTIRKMSGEFIESTFAEPTIDDIVGGNCNSDQLLQGPPGYCIIKRQTQTTPFDIVLPMLSSTVRFDIPMTGLYFEGRGKGIAVSGSKVLDLEIEAGYMFDLTVAEAGLAIGYRTSSLVADDLDELYSDAKLEGYYAGLKFHF